MFRYVRRGWRADDHRLRVGHGTPLNPVHWKSFSFRSRDGSIVWPPQRDETRPGRSMRTPFSILATLVLIAGAASGQTPLHIIPAGNGVEFVTAVAGAGDVDNDGHADFLIGTRNDEPSGMNSGSAVVRSGIDGSILYAFLGSAAGDQLGYAVSGAGDVNNDGFEDVIIGAPFADAGGQDGGLARLYSGLDGSVLYSFQGDSANDRLGAAVSGAGDVDADGFDDVVVGASGDSVNFLGSGTAFVYSGNTGAVLYAFHGSAAQDRLGTAVSGAGDVDADGYADVIVGAPYADNGPVPSGLDVGYARVYSGKVGATLYTFYGATYLARFGEKVGGAGDTNGDGYADLVVGAPNAFSQYGYAQVLSGKTGASLLGFAGGANGTGVGYDVGGAGDVNGDGRSDVLIGTNGDASVHSGASGAVLVKAEIPFWGSSPKVVASVAGDVNADGVADVIISTGSGAVFVHSGTNVAPAMPPFGESCGGITESFSPVLIASGSTLPGGYLGLAVHSAYQASLGVLMVGPAAAALPAGCGCSLLVQPVASQLLFPVNTSGFFVAGFPIPAGLSGASMKMQAWVPHPWTPCGALSTNGVSLDFP